MSANKNRRAGYQSTTKHPIEFGETAAKPRHIDEINIFENSNFGSSSRISTTPPPLNSFSSTCRTEANFCNGVPCRALTALSLPFAVICAAVIADKCSL
jgi:hypothetical protein